MDNIADKVYEIFKNCFWTEEEVKNFGKEELINKSINVQGVVNSFCFNPEKITANKNKIIEILNEMPKEFHKDSGGGMSFLNMCMDINGHQWGEHKNIEQLVCLGLATKNVKYGFPREMWNILPGGMPYICIDTKKDKSQEK